MAVKISKSNENTISEKPKESTIENKINKKTIQIFHRIDSIINTNINKEELKIFLTSFIKKISKNNKIELFSILTKFSKNLISYIRLDIVVSNFISSLKGLDNLVNSDGLSNLDKNNDSFDENITKSNIIKNFEILDLDEGKAFSKINKISLSTKGISGYYSVKIITEIINGLQKANPILKIELFCNRYEKIKFLEKKLVNNINFIVENNSGSVWGRDGAVIMNNKIIESYINLQGKSSSNMYDNLANRYNKELVQSSLYFEGGNIRQDEKFVFIGYNTIYQNISNSIKDFDSGKINSQKINAIKNRFEFEFGKKVIILGLDEKDGNYKIEQDKQDIFHIDMYFTPIGDNKILIGEFEKGNSKNKMLNRTAKKMQNLGYEVIRIKNYDYGHGQLTFNNVTIENYFENGKNIKNVYFPDYYEKVSNLSKINQNIYSNNAKNIYKKLGFNLIMIPISKKILNSKGSFNCLNFENR